VTHADTYQRLPEPESKKPRKSAIARVFSWLIGWALILGLIGAAAGGWAWLAFTAGGPLQQSTVINIERGLNRSEISHLLQDKGVISDARIFSAAAAVNTLRGRFIKPGEYEFPAGNSMHEVMAQMLRGQVLTYKLTIPEGWTTDMALQRIKENDVLAGEITKAPPEGALLANTLVFQRGMTRQQFIDSLVEQQSALLEEVWAKRPVDTPLKSKEELLTLASIVEKETGKPEERPAVAAVFLNRLNKGMRLQSDPTIIYGIVGGKGKLDRPLRRSDIDGATPYNTYTIDRLPPGPIATPGRASLEAVVRPDATDYLYFVADGTGGHAFARTLEEHNANVTKWRKIEDAAEAQTEAQTAEPPPQPANEPVAQPEQAGDLAAVPLEEPAPEATAPAAVAGQETPSVEAEPEAPPAASEDTQVAQAQQPPAQPETQPGDTEPVLDIKPGTVIQVGDKLIPIPAERALKQ
jgi:UPF0755 protein